MSLQTAAVVVISEQILRNKKCDSISNYLAEELNDLRYHVGKVTVIADDESLIVGELESMIKTWDIIIAVGEKCSNIYKAVGMMIGQQLQRSDKLATALKENGFYDEDELYIPIQAKVIHSNVYPVVHFQRIFILKESYVRQCFSEILKNHLTNYMKECSFTKVIKVCQNGNSNVDTDFTMLNGVKVECSLNEGFVLFNATSPNLSQIVDFEQKIKDQFGVRYCNNFVDDSDVWDNIYSSAEGHVRNAIETIEHCLKQYGPENVFMSFNGGKDCTVLLHLLLTVIKKKYSHHPHSIFCLYVQSENPFPEQDEFIKQCECYYNLRVLTIRSKIRDALQETLEKYPNYKACFMGTRRTDPFSSSLNVFQMTDPNWPQVMRASPLLDWHYSDIWDYLLYYKVPYCKLYDMGFTSLGNVVNTTKNPSLVHVDNEGKERYLPAHKLLKEYKERNGRDTNDL